MVGPGLSTFYTTGGTVSSPASVKAFFTALANYIPTGTTLTIPQAGDIIDDSTGGLTGTWTTTSVGGVVTCTGPGTYSKGVGWQVRWLTGGIVGGRRVVGSTFIVPLDGANWDSDGTLKPAFVSTAQAAVNALLTAEPTLHIWSRPVPPPTPPATTPAARAGTSNVVLAGVVQDRVSWLRSRRT